MMEIMISNLFPNIIILLENRDFVSKSSNSNYIPILGIRPADTPNRPLIPKNNYKTYALNSLVFAKDLLSFFE
jgi:hypothetical protein